MDFSKHKKNIIYTLFVGIGFYLLYHKTIGHLIHDWSNDPDFSHGFLIPFVTLYMIWTCKNKLSDTTIKSANTGLIIVMTGMLLHLLGNIGAELFTMRFSMVVTLAGTIVFLFGYQVFNIVAVPIAYLLMMIPIPAIIWNKLAFPLQTLAAKLSSITISLIGIPVYREGNILHLHNTSLEVIDACSGIRSLTSLLALTGAFAFLAPLVKGKKIILFLSAIPIAILANIIRLTLTGGMAAWISPETAHGFLHDMSGLVVFGSALVMVYGLYLICIKIENR